MAGVAAGSSSTVPLMMDIEGQPEEEDNVSGIKNDFAYHNNVAGAAKHIRMGEYWTLFKKYSMPVLF